MLGLGSTLMMSPDSVGEPAPFDETWTFNGGSADVSEWSFTDARISSLSYTFSLAIGGTARTHLMKISMVQNSSTGLTSVILADALAGCPDGASIKVEVDYGIGKTNDSTLRLATILAGGTAITIDASDQATNSWRTIAPATVYTMGSSDNDLVLRVPADTGINLVDDLLYVQRVRVYQV